MNSPQPLDCRNILYTPPGALSGSLGDVDVISHEGSLHLFHLVLPNHDVIAHAVSSDGFRWKAVDDALHTGRAGRFDDDMLWTMHVVRHPEKSLFHMYYTGCSRKEHGQVQRIGLAVSEDLMHWERFSEQPVLEAAGPFYNDLLEKVGFVSCRDPFVFVDDGGGWHMLFTARTRDGGRFASGCVGHAISKDGLEWALVEPLYAPGEFEDLEVPSLLRGPSGWSLFFNDFCRATTHCRVASTLDGPWRLPEKSQLLPSGQVTWRFCEWNGEQLLWNWIRGQADWPRRYCAAGTSFNALAPAKTVQWTDHQEPRLGSFSGWETLASSAWETWQPEDEKTASGWTVHPSGFVFEGRGRSSLFGKQAFDDFLLTFRLQVREVARCGVLFRVSDSREEWASVEFVPARQAVELHGQLIHRPSVPRLKIKGPTLAQQAPFLIPMIGESLDCRLVVCGEYLEFSVNGEVVISHMSYARKAGGLGLFASDGHAEFSDLRVCALAPPWQEMPSANTANP